MTQSSEGAFVGARVGIVEGSKVGTTLGISDGNRDGSALVGESVGFDTIGLHVGGLVTLGIFVGCTTGDVVGLMGFVVGESDGMSEDGHKVGCNDGVVVG